MASIRDRHDQRFCTPRRGWYCTYAKGHLAECDAWPEWWNWFDRKNIPLRPMAKGITRG